MKITPKTLAKAKAKLDKCERRAVNLRAQITTHQAWSQTTSTLTMYNLTAAEGRLAEAEVMVKQQEEFLFGEHLEKLIDGH